MKYLYKYPQASFPYENLVNTNRSRSRNEFEYELLDTGVFDEDRYFDVFVEYAKESPEDILIKITAFNRGPEPAHINILPTIWFRNVWSWGDDVEKPDLKQTDCKIQMRSLKSIILNSAIIIFIAKEILRFSLLIMKQIRKDLWNTKPDSLCKGWNK